MSAAAGGPIDPPEPKPHQHVRLGHEKTGVIIGIDAGTSGETCERLAALVEERFGPEVVAVFVGGGNGMTSFRYRAPA